MFCPGSVPGSVLELEEGYLEGRKIREAEVERAGGVPSWGPTSGARRVIRDYHRRAGGRP